MSQWEEDFPDDEVEDSTAKLSIESPKPAEAKVPTDSSKTDEAEVPGDIPKADEAKIPDEAEVPGDTPKADEAKIPADTPKAAEAEAPTEAPKAAIPPNSVSKDEKVENPTTSRSPKARGKAAEWPPKSKNEETQSTEEETGSKIATSEDILKKEESRHDAELQQLLKDIRRIGEEGKPEVLFGELFDDDQVANFYEALVGTLKSAKKRKMIDFKGQMLLKGAHDNVMVSIVGE